jgi:very-short-patch-repair endonuclease
MLIAEQVRTRPSRLEIFQDIGSIAESTVSEGDAVVEMFGWVNHNIAAIVKSITGRDGKYYTISHYTKDEDISLFVNFLRAYDCFCKVKSGYGDELDGTIAEIMNYIITTYNPDYMKKALNDYRYEIRKEELTIPPKTKRMKHRAIDFFRRIGLIQVYHAMPPMLPGDIERPNPKLVIESEGFPHCDPKLHAGVIRSAFEYLATRGHLVIREPGKEVRTHIADVVKTELDGKCVQKTVEGLNNPEHYIIMQKT